MERPPGPSERAKSPSNVRVVLLSSVGLPSMCKTWPASALSAARCSLRRQRRCSRATSSSAWRWLRASCSARSWWLWQPSVWETARPPGWLGRFWGRDDWMDRGGGVRPVLKRHNRDRSDGRPHVSEVKHDATDNDGTTRRHGSHYRAARRRKRRPDARETRPCGARTAEQRRLSRRERDAHGPRHRIRTAGGAPLRRHRS
jgi:hypothetical protein